MDFTTRKSFPLPLITDTQGVDQYAVVRDTVRRISELSDFQTDYNDPETITGLWTFAKSIITQAGIGHKLQNRTGTTRAVGDVVIINTAVDQSYIQPPTLGEHSSKVGVVTESTADLAIGSVAFQGIVTVKCQTTVTIGQYLITQASSYTAAGTSTRNPAAFGIALSPGSGGTCIALIGGVSTLDIGTGASQAAAGNDSRFPTADQKAALAGTTGTPSDGNRYVTSGDSRVQADQSAASASIRTLGSAATQAAPGNDARFPTADQKAALVGTTGTPSAANPYVTTQDTRLATKPFSKWIDAGAFELVAAGHPSRQKYVNLTNWPAIRVLSFDDGVVQRADVKLILPTSVPLASVKATLVWFCDAITTGSVMWRIYSITRTHDESLDVAGNINSATHTVTSVARRQRESEITLNISGWAAGEMIYLGLERVGTDAGDTALAPALFMGMRLESQ